MDPEFWHERWERDETAFDQTSANGLLQELWPGLGLPAGSEVFVPLCGRSVDMAWLAGQGHRVVGCELSELAVTSFFARQGLKPDVEPRSLEAGGTATVHTTADYELWCGDQFQLPASAVAGVAAVYDRASLVALPPDLRQRYAEHLMAILPAEVSMLFLGFEYDQAQMEGPPFSVTSDEVARLYGGSFQLEPLAKRDILVDFPYFAERGLTRLEETAALLTPR